MLERGRGRSATLSRSCIVAATTMLALMALASFANAAGVSFKGQGTSDERVNVRFKKEDREIVGLRIAGIRFECTDGSADRTVIGFQAIELRRGGGFRYRDEFGPYTVAAAGDVGRFKAKGRVRYREETKSRDCSGSVEWKAQRAG